MRVPSDQLIEHPNPTKGDGRNPRYSWLRPRSVEPPGRSSVWLVETTLLVLFGLLLAAATVYDVVHQTHINVRLEADMHTWRAFTGHDYHELSVSQKLLGATSQHEVVCGNTAPGPSESRTQLCLAIWGPIRRGHRTVHGGWYLPPRVEDVRSNRYGCFGEGSRGICPQ